jgi:hypothetical protein
MLGQWMALRLLLQPCAALVLVIALHLTVPRLNLSIQRLSQGCFSADECPLTQHSEVASNLTVWHGTIRCEKLSIDPLRSTI